MWERDDEYLLTNYFLLEDSSFFGSATNSVLTKCSRNDLRGDSITNGNVNRSED